MRGWHEGHPCTDQPREHREAVERKFKPEEVLRGAATAKVRQLRSHLPTPWD